MSAQASAKPALPPSEAAQDWFDEAVGIAQLNYDGRGLGQFSAWFSAIGTTASLFLALAILLRDKRKDDLAEARKLVISWQGPKDGVGHKVCITNASDRPFIEAGVFNLDQWRCDADPPNGPMLPGESRLYTHDGVGSSALAVQFTDGDGENWVRSLHSHQLVRCPQDPVIARHFPRRWARDVLRTDEHLMPAMPPHLSPLQHVGYRANRYLLAPARRHLLAPLVRCSTLPVRPLEPNARRGQGLNAHRSEADDPE
ncbi:hypothetical protein ABZ446_36080 [Streptomyces sp. NPDC005813]|uniref:hypothetical protein n=1 Tax=Streptomyces sp. NPDC005813 TaxID=3155592 RepID=UPI0033FBB118